MKDFERRPVLSCHKHRSIEHSLPIMREVCCDKEFVSFLAYYLLFMSKSCSSRTHSPSQWTLYRKSTKYLEFVTVRISANLAI